MWPHDVESFQGSTFCLFVMIQPWNIGVCWIDQVFVTELTVVIWDEVPTMVEIAIFWFQIHITNGLNFMHRKWHTGNQYMAKSAENWMRSNLELLPVINVKSCPRYISALKKSSSIYIGPKNLDTILMHWMSVKLADNFHRCMGHGFRFLLPHFLYYPPF